MLSFDRNDGVTCHSYVKISRGLTRFSSLVEVRAFRGGELNDLHCRVTLMCDGVFHMLRVLIPSCRSFLLSLFTGNGLVAVARRCLVREKGFLLAHSRVISSLAMASKNGGAKTAATSPATSPLPAINPRRH